MSDPRSKWRERTRAALQNYFARHRQPRLVLSAILVLTGALGLLISVALLHAGWNAMWTRYPVAVLGSYAGFLGLIRIWVYIEQRRFDPAAHEISANIPPPSWSPETPDYTWVRWLDASDFIDLEEGCLPALVAGAVLGVAGVLLVAVVNAPVLLAEVFLDAFLVSVLYRRLRIAAREHWLGTAIRKTWLSVLAIALLLALGGWALEQMAPGARSIGPAIHELLERQR